MPSRYYTDPPPLKDIKFMPSTLETVDGAVFDWLEQLNVFATTNTGWKKVPMVWVSSERAYQIKHDKKLRDSSGALILPIMSVQRTSVVKSLTRKGTARLHIPPVDDYKGASVTIAREINQEKSSNFAHVDTMSARGTLGFNKNNNKVVYETISIPMPSYLEMTYRVVLRSEYQQQINEMLTPFLTFPGGINYFNVHKDGHNFEAFMQEDFSQTDNAADLGEDERKYETAVEIKVLGYVIGADKNQDTPKIVRRQNAVEFKMNRETTVFATNIDDLVDVVNRNLISRAGSLSESSIDFGSQFANQRVINGSVIEDADGSIETFTTQYYYEPGTLKVFLNGQLQYPGAGNDYVEAGDSVSITFVEAPFALDVVTVDYLRKVGTV